MKASGGGSLPERGRRTAPRIEVKSGDLLDEAESRPACADNQRLLSMKAVNCDLDTAPTLVASTSPARNSINVGMPRMP